MIFLVFLLVTAGLVVSAPVTSVNISEQSYYTPPAIVAEQTVQEASVAEPGTAPSQEETAPLPETAGAGQEIIQTEAAAETTEDEYAAMLAAAIAAWEQAMAEGGIPGQGAGMIPGEEEDEVRLPGETLPAQQRKVIVLGDSRTVALYCSQVYDEQGYLDHIWNDISTMDYTGYVGNTIFIARGGEGGYWMEGVAVPLAERFIDENTAIVVWFGVNDLDLGLENLYLKVLNGRLLSYGIPVYFMQVGPCNGKSENKNTPIDIFNWNITQNLDPRVNVIEVNPYIFNELMAGNFHTLDGLHYDYNTSRNIFQFMMNSVQY